MSQQILITGVTGKQGGAVARALAGNGAFKLRGLTRKPDSEPARAMAKLGIDIVAGDLDDEASLKKALAGAWGVFAMANTWEAGVVKEEEQAKRIARLARDAGVQHYVYSSVGSAERKTGIPHFENKWRVEGVVRELRFPSHVVIRPVFFMENLPSPWFLHGDKLISSLEPTTKLQMIATRDIGIVGAKCFIDPAKHAGKAYELAGDALTLPEAAATMSTYMGKKIEYVRIPNEEVRKNSEDFASMLAWFDRVGYGANIPELATIFAYQPTTFDQWARETLRP